MAWGQRFKAQFKTVFGNEQLSGGGSVDGTPFSSPPSPDRRDVGGGLGGGGVVAVGDLEWQQAAAAQQQVQYRLEATLRAPAPLWKRILTCGCFQTEKRSNTGAGINPNQRLALYLHWMFRVNFGFLFAIMCVMFFALVIFFAALVSNPFFSIHGNPSCLRLAHAIRKLITIVLLCSVLCCFQRPFRLPLQVCPKLCLFGMCQFHLLNHSPALTTIFSLLCLQEAWMINACELVETCLMKTTRPLRMPLP